MHGGLAVALVLALMGSCGDRGEPPRGVSMAPSPMLAPDSGPQAQAQAMFVRRVYKGQVMLHGISTVDPLGTQICLDVRNSGADAFVGHLDFGGKYTADIHGPPRQSFQMCMQNLAPRGAEVRVIADAVMEGPITVGMGVTVPFQ